MRGIGRPGWFAAFGFTAFMIAVAGGFVGMDALRGPMTNTSLGVMGIGVLAAALAALYMVNAMTRTEVQVDADGVELKLRGKVTRIRFSEPHDVYYREIGTESTPVVKKVSVKASDGRLIDVNIVSVPGSPNMHVPKLVEQKSVAAQWPKIQTRVAAGQDVSFGAARVAAGQLHIGGQSYPLDRPISLQVEQGKLKVGAGGKWTATDVRVLDVANYTCLLRAIGQITQAQPPG